MLLALAPSGLAAAAFAQARTSASSGRTGRPPHRPFSLPPRRADAAATSACRAQGGTDDLLLRGLDKITGRPTDIVAPIGKPVHFATLTITARYCYSTRASETPETAAFVQIEDHRPDQSGKARFFPAGCMPPAPASMPWSIRSMMSG